MHVINKRDDGYHNLQTIFQLLDFCDELSFEKTANGVIKRISGNENIPPEQDLIIRSATLFQQYLQCDLGVNININKKIPVGGGLGGSSSNAATTLIALNELWQAYLPSKILMKIGLQLGADVPIFIAGNSAWAEGVGEILTPIKLPKTYFLVVCINQSISTQQVFSHKALTLSKRIGKIAPFSELVNPHNDCIAAAIELESEILDALNHLKSVKSYHYQPRMTGTGSCVFVEFEYEKDALVARNNLPKKWTGFVAQAINTSPTLNWAVAKR